MSSIMHCVLYLYSVYEVPPERPESIKRRNKYFKTNLYFHPSQTVRQQFNREH